MIPLEHAPRAVTRCTDCLASLRRGVYQPCAACLAAVFVLREEPVLAPGEEFLSEDEYFALPMDAHGHRPCLVRGCGRPNRNRRLCTAHLEQILPSCKAGCGFKADAGDGYCKRVPCREVMKARAARGAFR
jgi:hypothetical protein